MTDNLRLVVAFERLIKQEGPWDLFFNVTFRRKKSVLVAKRLFKGFFKYLNRPRSIFFDKFVICLVFFEKDSSRSGVHIHALIRGIGPSYAPLLTKRCKRFKVRKQTNSEKSEHPFGITAVLPYDSERAARFYLSWKYVSSGLVHWDIYKINSRVR